MNFNQRLTMVVLLLLTSITFFSGSSSAASLPLRLVWERNTESDLAYYTVYYGTASGTYSSFMDVDKANPYFVFTAAYLAANGITVGPGGRTLYVALTATDFSLNESDYSRELVIFVDPPTTTTSSTPATTTIPNASTTTTTAAAGTTRLFIEAESGTIQAPIVMANDGAASSGQYIFAPNGSGDVMDSNQAGGYAEYSFQITREADYVIWGRVLAASNGDDSFFVSVDGGPYLLWDTVMSGTGLWEWDMVNDRGLADPVIVHLKVGTHALVIKQREDGTKLDRLLITSDMGYVPVGKGEDTVTTTVPPTGTRKDYCSSDPALILHGTIPEEGTMGISIPDSLLSAASASLVLTLFDPDISGEGEIYINGKGPVSLPFGDYDSVEHTFEVPITASWLVRGQNTIRFTHVNTWGYEVRALCARVLFKTSQTTTTTVPVPVTTSVTTTTTPVTTTIKPDVTPPVGLITINHGDATTNSRIVMLSLSAEDTGSGMGPGAQMMLSTHLSQQWSDPMPFEPQKIWTLSFGKGVKTIYAKFCDAAGNWMTTPVSDSIEFVSTCSNSKKLGCSVLQSSGSFLASTSAKRAIDNNENTGWISPLRISPREEYMTLDLGEITVINQISINSKPFFARNLFPSDFHIEVSTDNEYWTPLFWVEDYSPPASHSEVWTFEETEARYVKMVATKARPVFAFLSLTHVAEISIYGCAGTETAGLQAAPGTSAEQDDANSMAQAEQWLRKYGFAGNRQPFINGDSTGGSYLRNGSAPVTAYGSSVVICDDTDSCASFTGIWDGSTLPDAYQSSSLISETPATHTWTPDLPQSGAYAVYMWWGAGSAHCSSCPVAIACSGELIDTVYIDQEQGGGQWNLLGTYYLEAGGGCSITLASEGSGLRTCADAVMFSCMGNHVPAARIDSIVPNPGSDHARVCFSGRGLQGDGATTEGYRWISDLDGELAATGTFCTSSLSVGTHRISFYVADEKGLWSAPAHRTLSIIRDSMPQHIWLEAEEGSINQPLEQVQDETASNGEYIWTPDDGGDIIEPLQDGGAYAEYSFEVFEKGDYIMWGRVMAGNADTGSFSISVDNGTYALWDILPAGDGTWFWERAHNRGGADALVFHLDEGMHTMVIKHREDGSKIDRILFSTDITYKPAGRGE